MKRASPQVVMMLTALAFVAAALAAGAAPGGPPMAMQVTSTSFAPGGDIPKRFTCDGADVSPQLSWAPAPAGTKSFTLIADDPDAPRGTWTHWVVFDLPPPTHELREDAPKSEQAPGGGSQGRNDFGKIGYGGPCPPPGKPHRYFFKVYALDTTLGLKPGAARAAVERALQGHVLAEGQVMGRYGR